MSKVIIAGKVLWATKYVFSTHTNWDSAEPLES
jgi:hypothetical protein